MAVKGKNVKGLQVFSLKQSKKIASIYDLICDPNGRKISAFTVSKRSLFTEMQVIPFEEVKSIGEDAVVVQSEEAIKKVSRVDKRIQQMVRDNNYIIDTAVITEDGVNLGKIADVFFDPKTGSVEEIEVTQGPLKDVSEGRKKISGGDIVKVGKDNTIVSGDTDEKLAAKTGGGLKGMMKHVHGKIADVVEKVPFKDKKK